jgi:hypothetical protein
MKTSRLVLSIPQILCSEHLFFLSRKKMDHSDYVLISNGLMLSLGKTSILYQLTSELLDTLSRAKVFTKIDLKHAYHLIRIAARDEWKTVFHTMAMDLLNG